MPMLALNYIPPDMKVILHSENGILGLVSAGSGIFFARLGQYFDILILQWQFPYEVEEDPDLINIWKETVTLVTSGSYFSR